MKSVFLSTEQLIETALEKRCIADVLKKGGIGGSSDREKLSHAFAICKSSMQRAGNYRKGSESLTKQGAKRSTAHSKRKDQSAKMAVYSKALANARKD
jgi:hypothetical protein